MDTPDSAFKTVYQADPNGVISSVQYHGTSLLGVTLFETWEECHAHAIRQAEEQRDWAMHYLAHIEERIRQIKQAQPPNQEG